MGDGGRGMRGSLVRSAAVLVLISVCGLLIGACAQPPEEQGRKDPERTTPAPEAGEITLPKPEEERYGTLKWPLPVWRVSGGRTVQASYGEYCEWDVCGGEVVPKQPGGEPVTAQVRADEPALLVVGRGVPGDVSVGVVGWEDQPSVQSFQANTLTGTGVPYFMRPLDARRRPEAAKPTVEPADGGTGLTVYELASTGNAGDRTLSAFLDIAGDPASYHWRLNPGQPGENPPPPQESFPGSVVQVVSTPETVSRTEDEVEKALPAKDVRKVPFGRAPAAIHYGEGYPWVEDGRLLLKVDPASLKVVSRTRLDRGLFVMDVGAGAVWAIDDRTKTVFRLDPGSGEVLKRIRIGGYPSQVVATSGAVWVASYGEGSGNRVSRIDPTTNEVAAEIETPGGAEDVAVDGETGDVWAVSVDRTDGYANEPNGQLLRISAGSDRITGRYAVDGVEGVEAGGGTVWAKTDDRFEKVDPEAGELEATVPFGASWAEIGEGLLWNANQGRATAASVEDGRVLASVKMGEYETDDLAVGGGAVWILGGGTNRGGTLTRITP